jgi:hypothetical protein
MADDITLSDRDRKLLVKLFSNPLAFPSKYKQWLTAWLEINPPKLQSSAVQGGSAVYPYTVQIIPWHPVSNTNFNSLVADSASLMGGYLRSSGAQNAECTFDVVLGDGTWALYLLHHNDSDYGIYTVTLDSTALGTVDGYSAAGANNDVDILTDIRIDSPAKRTLKFVMATKNGSSSSYKGAIQLATFLRTS